MPILKHADFEVPGFGEFASPPLPVPAYADAVSSLNPLAYWRLGESGGATLSDETGNHPLSLTGTYLLSQGGALQTDTNTAMLIEGPGRAAAAGPVVPVTPDAPFSILFWARLPQGVADRGPFIGQFTDSGDGDLRINLLSDKRLRMLLRSGSNQQILSTQLIDEDWRQVVLTRSIDGTMSWYFDTQADTQVSGLGQAIISTSFVVGNVVASNPSSILLDEIAVFDDELDLGTIRWLYGLGVGQLPSPPTS